MDVTNRVESSELARHLTVHEGVGIALRPADPVEDGIRILIKPGYRKSSEELHLTFQEARELRRMLAFVLAQPRVG